jgi:hypothetical protein
VAGTDGAFLAAHTKQMRMKLRGSFSRPHSVHGLFRFARDFANDSSRDFAEHSRQYTPPVLRGTSRQRAHNLHAVQYALSGLSRMPPQPRHFCFGTLPGTNARLALGDATSSV